MTRRAHRLVLQPETAERIRTLHPQLKREVRPALERILAAPDVGKPLQEELQGYWSDRIRRMRVIYRVEPGQVVYVLTLGPRRTVYEESERLLRADAVPRKPR